MGKLHVAASRGKNDEIKKMIAKGADVDERDENGAPPLHFACFYGMSETASVLIELGAQVNIANDLGYSPLMAASHEGRTKTVQLLIDRGANVNDRTAEGFTALYYAASFSPTVEPALLLLANGADPNARDYRGGTPFMTAAWRGNLDLVKAMFEYGADPNLVTNDSKSAIDFARDKDRTAVIDYLAEQNTQS